MTLIHDLGIRNHKVDPTVSRRQAIRECKTLLERLYKVVYSMDWHGPIPNLDKCEGYDSGIMEIVVQNKFNIHRIFQLKKQDATRKIKIWNNDVK